MNLIDLGAILVAVIAALGAWAAQHSAAKASKINTEVSGRLLAEQGAYERARAFDTATIASQNREIERLRDSNHTLRNEIQALKNDMEHLKEMIPDIERYLDDRTGEADGD